MAERQKRFFIGNRAARLLNVGAALGALLAFSCHDATDSGVGPTTTPKSADVAASDADTPAEEPGASNKNGGNNNDNNNNDPGADGGSQTADASDVPDAAVGGDASVVPGKAKVFGFVGSGDGKIRVYRVDAAAGTWALATTVNAGQNPSFLAFDEPHHRVFAVDETNTGRVRSFGFDAASATLKETNNVASGGAAPTHLSVHPSGRWLMVAHYGTGNVSIVPISANGTLGALSDSKASGAMTHWAGATRAGDYVLVNSLGGNAVVSYKFDATSGKLTDNASVKAPANAGPRHLAFHPTEKWAYVVNEKTASVSAFSFDSALGRLTAATTVSALPQPKGGSTGAEIAVHPSGRFVYASTRGTNAVAQFGVDAKGAGLAFVQSVPTGAAEPRSMALDPDGKFLFAGNLSAAQVVGFRIDQATGKLTSLGKTVDVASPTFVGLARFL
jgi:6-phosphogluconolactonase